ncbi:MAG: Bug family tripartite tricarboxylate transporter substrate binding protein [Betaproteobacteria bacterium]
MPVNRFAAALVAALLPSLALAQAWPSKPVRIVIAFAPGGATDVAVRSVADPVSQAIGQPVVIENRAGASGAVAADAVLRAGADGYTLLATADVMASTPHLFKLSFDPLKDFVPVIQLTLQPVVLAVHPSLGAGTLAELIALLKKSPGTSYATSGAGSQQHFTAEWFAKVTGVTLNHIPYKGGGQAIGDLVGGQVKMGSLGSTPVIPHHKAGKLKILAQSTAKRAASLPDVPTYREQGVDLEIDQWLAVFAPAGTPREAVVRLNAEMARALATPAVQARYATAALEAVGGTPEQLGAVLKRDFEKFGRLTKELKLRVD